MSIQLSETVRIDTDNAYGNDVSNVDNSGDNTKYSVKMPWLCMLCKMCDVRVCIGLVVFAADAMDTEEVQEFSKEIAEKAMERELEKQKYEQY